jgi:predicted NUDIX family phosphoesterase
MEFVYVVPREALFPDAYPHGFVRQGGALLRTFERVLAQGFFVERERAERSPQWKQVIPYSVLISSGSILLLERLKAGGEARLHHKLSIGVGGHVNPEDLAASVEAGSDRGFGMLDAGTRRELSEELALEGQLAIERVGLINDDSNSVGAVHVGLVQRVVVQGPIAIRETNALRGQLVEPDALRGLLTQGANFESWSALLIAHLDEILHPAQRPDPALLIP